MLIQNPTFTGSISLNGTNVASITGSFESSASLSTRVTNLETTSSNLTVASSSFSTRVTSIEANYATTGSNTLTGTQNITNTTVPTNFDDTAALYTAGGLRVKGNVYLSSSLYLKGDLTVYGTQSINYITSSQLDISDNIINVNTATPGVRFGGIAVYDSGSTGLTGSFLWDSQNNKWIYSNPSGSSYDGGMAIFGPRNSSGLGSEQGTTNNALMKGQGGDHITSSLITEDGALMSVYSTMYISSSGNVGIGVTNPQSILQISNGSIVFSETGYPTARLHTISHGHSDGSAPSNYLGFNISDGAGSGTTYERMRINGNGYVGIGLTNPPAKLSLVGGSTLQFGIDGNSGNNLIYLRGGTTGDKANITLNHYGYADYTISAGGTSNGVLSITKTLGGSDGLAINSSGYVGINTVTPSAQGLTIFQDGGDRRIMLELNRNNTPGLQSAIQFTVGNSIMVGQIQHEYAASNQNHMSFSLRNSGGGNFVALWLQNDGNVGIGNTSPYSKLDVRGAIAMGNADTYPKNVRFVKQGSTSVTFTASAGTIGAWRPGHALIKVSGAQNGLQEYWAAWFFIRIVSYFGSGAAIAVVDSGGDTGSVSFSSSANTSSPQTMTFTLTDSGGTTNTMIADIDLTYNEGIVSIS